jgi:hypothetical protein
MLPVIPGEGPAPTSSRTRKWGVVMGIDTSRSMTRLRLKHDSPEVQCHFPRNIIQRSGRAATRH